MFGENSVCKEILSVLLSLIMAAIFVPEINGASFADVQGGNITGFVPLETSEYCYEGDPEERDLLNERLPDTLGVFLNDSDSVTRISVKWEAMENVDKTDFYFYSLRPLWDSRYQLDESLSEITDVPWITVYKELSEEEKEMGETEPEIPEEEIRELETLYEEISEDDNREPVSSEMIRDIIFSLTDEVYAGSESDVSATYKYLTKTMGLNMAAACGVMTNLYAESGIIPNNLENTYNKKYDLTDAEYTKRVNKKNGTKGKYKRGTGETGYFTTDYCGYGICQWTSSGRRAGLYGKVYGNSTSIADLNMQLGFLHEELKESYPQVYYTLKNVPNNATGVYLSAADFCNCFEVPADTINTASARGKNALSGYWKTYSGSAGSSETSHIGICGYTYPESVKKGNGVLVSGHVISNYPVKSVRCRITTADGEVKYSKTINPDKYIYSLKNFDSEMLFDKLSEGKFRYEITAKDSKGVLAEAAHEFTVGTSEKTKVSRTVAVSEESEEKSELKITGAVYPEMVIRGEDFKAAGTVRSNYPINSVSVKIIDSEGKAVFSVTAKPESESFQISDIADELKFSELTVGTYSYKVKAEDTKKTKTLLNKEFDVKAPSKAVAVNCNYPKTLKKGKSFSIKGKVKSNYRISKVTAGIYTSAGKAKCKGTAKPGAKSYNIKGLDSKLLFNKLSKGTYIYKIKVQDEVAVKTVLKKKLKVK